MFLTPETLWTALVLAFWFSPILFLFAAYVIGAAAWAPMRTSHGSGDQPPAHPATVPVGSGRS